MKKDKYLRARGGTFKILNIFCAGCGAWVVQYEKDGPGDLLRCYLNRIIAPPELEALQNDPKVSEPKDMANLLCQNCKTLIGTPMRYRDGRLAFMIKKGTFSKKILKGG